MPWAEQVEAVYRSRRRVMLRVAAGIVGDAELATEVVQEAFATALSSGRRFRGDARVETWIFRIVVNGAVDQARVRDRRWPPTLARRCAEEASDELGFDDRHERLRLVIRELPERQRLALFLRYYADLDYRAIAEVLNVRTGTVSATLNAAHGALRRSLEVTT